MNLPVISQKYRVLAVLALLLSAALYYLQGYLISRSQFEAFFGSYLLLFGLFYWLWLNKQQFSFGQFFGVALVLRLILVFSIPALSNDYFRFIWDGELIVNSVNPYAHRPDDLISFGGFLDKEQMRMLYHGMGELSQQSYSCYPPLNQLFFVIPAALSDNIHVQLIIFKLIMILADIGIILVGKKLLEHFKLSTHLIWLFALNPFIILEFTGNIHFEGVMIFFLLSAVYLLLKKQWIFSIFFFAFAVQVKLIPLIVLPLFVKELGFRRFIIYSSLSFVLILLIGNLMLNEVFLFNMLDSIDNYFERFEFNAGIFYLLREGGFALYGYDTIQSIMPWITRLILLSILGLALFRNYRSQLDLPAMCMFAFLIFYGLASTVHPWYISLILIFSIFTHYRFALVWSFLVMLSYSAYIVPEVAENAYLLCTEYLVLAALLIYEIKKNHRSDLLQFQPERLWKSKS